MDSRIADLICAGFEGGVGYWCVITGFTQPEAPRSAHGDTAIFPHMDYPLCGGAVLCVAHVEDEPETLTLDREAVDRGLTVMRAKYPHHWSSFVHEDEDAETGDVFIQCALLGDVVYG